MEKYGDSGTNSMPSKNKNGSIVQMAEIQRQSNHIPIMLTVNNPIGMYMAKKNPIIPRIGGVDISPVTNQYR